MTTMQPGVMARNRTPAALAAHRAAMTPQPPRRYSQAELRERRRTGLTVGHYDGTWSLAREVAEQVNPLAQRIAADDRPSRFMRSTATVLVHSLGQQIYVVSPLDVERRAREGKVPPPPAWMRRRIT